ncbi:MAG: hypothetical protein BGO72_13335 [Burkholderiales bacterium 70-64]|nr:MAG: hypothetical protein BGO72_13335 [Burkholderiales bacterium 70-64]
MVMEAKRVKPVANSYMHTQPIWDAARNGRLLVQRCDDTKRLQHPPRPVSVYTGSKNLSWVEVSGFGSIYSWTVTTSAWPGHEHRVPYVCGLVLLNEGVRMLCNLINIGEAELKVGRRVRVAWEELGDGFLYPAFELLPDR